MLVFKQPILICALVVGGCTYAGAEEYQYVELTRRYDGLLAGDEAYRMHEAQRWSQVARQAELNYGLSWLSRPPVLYPGAWYGVPWAYESAWPEPAYFPGPYNPYATRYGLIEPPEAPPVVEDEIAPLDEPAAAAVERPAPADAAADIAAPREF